MKFRFQLFFTLLLIVLFVPGVQAEDDWGSSYNLLVKKAINEEWFLLSRSNLATRRDNEQLFLGYTGASLGYQINKEEGCQSSQVKRDCLCSLAMLASVKQKGNR